MARDLPSSSKKTPDPHDRSALLQAFQDVVRDQQGKEAQPTSSASPAGRHTYTLVMLGLAAGLLTTLALRPAWLFPPPIVESTQLREASLRVRMYVEITRVDQFRAANGRLPATLSETGADTTGLQYTKTSGGYTLTGVSQGVTLTYTSGTAPETFIGASYALIKQRKRS